VTWCDVAVHHGRTPVQHPGWARSLPLQAGSWSHYQPAVSSAKTRQADHLWFQSRAWQMGDWTNWDTDEPSAWCEQNVFVL